MAILRWLGSAPRRWQGKVIIPSPSLELRRTRPVPCYADTETCSADIIGKHGFFSVYRMYW